MLLGWLIVPRRSAARALLRDLPRHSPAPLLSQGQSGVSSGVGPRQSVRSSRLTVCPQIKFAAMSARRCPVHALMPRASSGRGAPGRRAGGYARPRRARWRGRVFLVDVRGEILELKNTINIMVDQLNGFASVPKASSAVRRWCVAWRAPGRISQTASTSWLRTCSARCATSPT
jgi:hypothetical protein